MGFPLSDKLNGAALNEVKCTQLFLFFLKKIFFISLRPFFSIYFLYFIIQQNNEI